MQHNCVDNLGINIPGLGPVTTCSTRFRFEWFVIALHFVLAIGAFIVIGTGNWPKMRLGSVTLFMLSAILYTMLANQYLIYLDTYYSKSDFIQDTFWWFGSRIQTTVAGFIMVATMDCLVCFIGGIKNSNKVVAVPEVDIAQRAEETAA